MEEIKHILYASTASGIDGLDGFGIRYQSPGIPKEIVEAIQERKVFSYSAGSKALPEVDKIVQNPSLPLDFPVSYQLFTEHYHGEPFFIFSRTIFLGRDYGWYEHSPLSSSRSGNLCAHVLIRQGTENYRFTNLYDLLSLFKPVNWVNDQDNKELQTLLSNPGFNSDYLKPCKTKHRPKQELPNRAYAMLFLQLIKSVLQKKILLIKSGAYQVYEDLICLTQTMPDLIRTQVSFRTNYQEYGLTAQYKVIELNDCYEGHIPEDRTGLSIFDPSHLHSSQLTEIQEEFINDILSGNTLQDELQHFAAFTDSFLVSLSDRVEIDVLIKAWYYLGDNTTEKAVDQDTSFIKAISAYHIRESFKQEIKSYAFDLVLEIAKSGQFEKLDETFFNLVTDNDLSDAEKFELIEVEVFSQLHKQISDDLMLATKHGKTKVNERAATVLDRIKDWEGLVPGLEPILKEWKSNTNLRYSSVGGVLFEMGLRIKFFGLNEQEVVQSLVNSKVEEAWIEQYLASQNKEEVNLEKCHFLPEIKDAMLYRKHFDSATKKFIEVKIEEGQSLSQTLDRLRSVFAEREELLLYYLEVAMKRDASSCKIFKDALNWMNVDIEEAEVIKEGSGNLFREATHRVLNLLIDQYSIQLQPEPRLAPTLKMYIDRFDKVFDSQTRKKATLLLEVATFCESEKAEITGFNKVFKKIRSKKLSVCLIKNIPEAVWDELKSDKNGHKCIHALFDRHYISEDQYEQAAQDLICYYDQLFQTNASFGAKPICITIESIFILKGKVEEKRLSKKYLDLLRLFYKKLRKAVLGLDEILLEHSKHEEFKQWVESQKSSDGLVSTAVKSLKSLFGRVKNSK